MMKKVSWFLFMCSLAACATDPIGDHAVSADEQAVSNTTDTDPSVVAVFAHAPGATSGNLCTGTVISSRTVLTAAHCLSPAVIGTGNVFEVLVGTTLSTATSLAVSSTAFDTAFNPGDLFAGHDIGVVQLAAPTTLAPVRYNRSFTPNLTEVVVVGYGTQKRANVTASIVSATSLLLQLDMSSAQTCPGGSGAPALQTINGVPTIVGVTSFGPDNGVTSVCLGGGFDTRVDAVRSFIDANVL